MANDIEFNVGDKVKISEKTWKRGVFSSYPNLYGVVFEVLKTQDFNNSLVLKTQDFNNSLALHLKDFIQEWIFAHYFELVESNDSYTLCEIED